MYLLCSFILKSYYSLDCKAKNDALAQQELDGEQPEQEVVSAAAGEQLEVLDDEELQLRNAFEEPDPMISVIGNEEELVDGNGNGGGDEEEHDGEPDEEEVEDGELAFPALPFAQNGVRTIWSSMLCLNLSPDLSNRKSFCCFSYPQASDQDKVTVLSS